MGVQSRVDFSQKAGLGEALEPGGTHDSSRQHSGCQGLGGHVRDSGPVVMFLAQGIFGEFEGEAESRGTLCVDAICGPLADGVYSCGISGMPS